MESENRSCTNHFPGTSQYFLRLLFEESDPSVNITDFHRANPRLKHLDFSNPRSLYAAIIIRRTKSRFPLVSRAL